MTLTLLCEWIQECEGHFSLIGVEKQEGKTGQIETLLLKSLWELQGDVLDIQGFN